MRQRFASDSVAPQAECHADGGGAEAVMEADVFLQEAGDERAEETTDVDGDVENGKTGIAQWAQLFVFIKRADHRTGGCLDAAAAEGDADQTGNHAVHARDESKCDMAAHDEDARVKQGAFCAPEAVGQPAAEDGGKVNAAAVSADDTARDRLAEAEAAFADAVIEVNGEDALHPVEGKALPQFDVKERGELARMAEEGLAGGLAWGEF